MHEAGELLDLDGWDDEVLVESIFVDPVDVVEAV